jgi:hypothetical protein
MMATSSGGTSTSRVCVTNPSSVAVTFHRPGIASVFTSGAFVASGWPFGSTRSSRAPAGVAFTVRLPTTGFTPPLDTFGPVAFTFGSMPALVAPFSHTTMSLNGKV